MEYSNNNNDENKVNLPLILDLKYFMILKPIFKCLDFMSFFVEYKGKLKAMPFLTLTLYLKNLCYFSLF